MYYDIFTNYLLLINNVKATKPLLTVIQYRCTGVMKIEFHALFGILMPERMCLIRFPPCFVFDTMAYYVDFGHTANLEFLSKEVLVV